MSTSLVENSLFWEDVFMPYPPFRLFVLWSSGFQFEEAQFHSRGWDQHVMWKRDARGASLVALFCVAVYKY